MEFKKYRPIRLSTHLAVLISGRSSSLYAPLKKGFNGHKINLFQNGARQTGPLHLKPLL